MASTALALSSPSEIASTIASSASEALPLPGLVHDARNLVTALCLCAEMLAEPGVLAPRHSHFARELSSVADASERLMRQLSSLARDGRRSSCRPVDPQVTDLAETLRRLGGLLSAMAGPKIVVQTACLPCAGILRLSEESLTRILLNLVRNSAGAMPEGGRIRITAQRGGGASFYWTLPEPSCQDGVPATVILTVEDTGPGNPATHRERIFAPGFSTRRDAAPWLRVPHQGLGLSMVRQLVEDSGGTVRASASPPGGARFEIEWPVTTVTPPLPLERPVSTGVELP